METIDAAYAACRRALRLTKLAAFPYSAAEAGNPKRAKENGAVLTSLARKQFVDRVLEAEDLAALAELLTSWQSHQAPGGGGVPIAAASPSAGFWGFARADGDLFARKIAYRAESRQIAGVTLTRPDPDTLIVTLTAPPAGSPVPAGAAAGALFALVVDRDFNNQCVEFRLPLRGRGSGAGALVLYGAVQHGRYRLKALWRAGAGDFAEELYAHAPWPHEAQLLAALHDFRATGSRAVPAWAPAALFPDGSGRAVGSAVAWFLRPAADGVGAFLGRVGLAASVAGLCAYALARRSAPGFSFLFGAGLIIGLLALVYTVGIRVWMVVLCRQMMRANQQKMQTQAMSFPELNLAEQPGALEDPSLLKLSRDLAALGGVHFKDITVEPAVFGTACIRLFLFPDEATLFSLMLLRGGSSGDGDGPGSMNNHIFPARANFLLRTGLDNGERLVSINGGGGHRKPLPGASVISRVFPGMSDPERMLQKHRNVLQRLEREGRRRVPLEPERLVAQLLQDQEEEIAPAKRHNRYFGWADAFRMVFHIVLPQYRAE